MRIVKALPTTYTTVFMLIAIATQAQGATIFTNLGADNSSYPRGSLISVPGTTSLYLGMGFTPIGQSYTLDSIELPLVVLRAVPLADRAADVFIMGSDNGGLPSGVLESFQGYASTLCFSCLTTFDSTVHPTLNEGAQYWIVAAARNPTSQVGWGFSNELGEMVPNVRGPSLAELIPTDESLVMALRVSGTEIPGTEIPEPAMLGLASGALVAFTLFVRTRRRTDCRIFVRRSS